MVAVPYNEEFQATTNQNAVERRATGKSRKDDHTKTLHRVQRLANLMDSRFSVPGIPVRFGVDSVIGLVPGIGDVVTAATSLWMLREAHRVGLPKRRMAKMLANIGIDLTVGAIPLVGDVFDVFWKSNVRNARLLEQHLQGISN